MKKKMFGLLAMGMCVVSLGVFTTGCSFLGTGGSEAGSSDVAQGDSGKEGETETQKETEAEKKFSNEEAIEASKQLFEKAVDCVKNEDREGLRDLIIYDDRDEIDQKYIDNFFEMVKTYVSNNYTSTEYYNICGDGKTFATGILSSLVSGQYPDTKSMKYTIYLGITYTDGKWGIVNSEEGTSKINEMLINNFPTEVKDARENGRNCTRFETFDLTWLDPTVVIPGTLDASVYLAWQNEDGSVGILVNVKNGTDEIRSINSIDVTLTDESLGEILYVERTGEMIEPKRSRNYTITVDPADVKTGTETWTQISAHVHTSNN